MPSSAHLIGAAHSTGACRVLWSVRLECPPRGLCLAREPGSILIWDDWNSLHLINRSGNLQGRTRLPGKVMSACCSDDGSAIAAVGSLGEVWRFTPDFMPRWERSVPKQAVGCALDALGLRLAVTGARGGVHVFDRDGKEVTLGETARALAQLTFVPEETLLVGCADFGLVACLDESGHCVWRDGLVTNIGSVAVSGDGNLVLFACFSDGVYCYSARKGSQGKLEVPEPCKLTAMSYDGQRILVGGLKARMYMLDPQGHILSQIPLDAPPVALGLSALGETAFAALADGQIVALALK